MLEPGVSVVPARRRSELREDEEGKEDMREGGLDPLWVGQTVEGVLKIVLPPEDWESELERGIVKEVVGRIVIGGVVKKVAQPWFWWGMLSGLLGGKKTGAQDESDGAVRFLTCTFKLRPPRGNR
jgi:hypothetical protein